MFETRGDGHCRYGCESGDRDGGRPAHAGGGRQGRERCRCPGHAGVCRERARLIAGGDPDVTVAERGEGAASGHGRAGQREGSVNQSGVTLLELLVTITIIMLLASVAMPLSKVLGKRACGIELRQERRSFRASIDAFKLDWNRDGL